MASPSSQLYLYAQRLNNSASSCIEIGLYERAISSLTLALRLSKSAKQSIEKVSNSCYECTLDGCIVRSETNTAMTAAATKIRNKKKRKLSSGTIGGNDFKEQQPSDKKQCNTNVTPKEGNNNSDRVCGYIYRRPIRVCCNGLATGSTLYLIIVFNLALAHHSIAVSSSNVSERNKFINNSLELYKLSYEVYNQEVSGKVSSSTSSLFPSSSSSSSSSSAFQSTRLKMIILNNRSQICRLAHNYSEYKECLQHLLSTVMTVVDQNARTTSTTVNKLNQSQRTELDGFLQNATALILQEECSADAAWVQ